MKPENVTCPECGGRMVSRLNSQQNSRFWGCADYPRCKGTRNADGESREQRWRDPEAEPDEPKPSRWRDEATPDTERPGRRW
jgi:ssDNA-binding Zn-finger/Zn-ribbon topoisomerase 1